MNPENTTPEDTQGQPMVSPTLTPDTEPQSSHATAATTSQIAQPAVTQNSAQQTVSSAPQATNTVTKQVGGMFSRRMGRAGFFGGSLYLTLILTVAALLIAGIQNTPTNDTSPVPGLILIVACFIVYAPFAWSLSARRLHDINTSAGFAVISLLPLFNVFMWLFLVFAPGEPNTNEYGPAIKSKNPFVLLGLKRPNVTYEAGAIELSADQKFASASYKDGVLFQQKHQNRNDAPTGRLSIAGNYLKFTSDNGQELLNLDINNIKRVAFVVTILELAVWDRTTDYGFYFPGWKENLGATTLSTGFGLLGGFAGDLNSLRLQNKSEAQEFIRALKTINPNISTWNLSWKNSLIIGFIVAFVLIAALVAFNYLVHPIPFICTHPNCIKH